MYQFYKDKVYIFGVRYFDLKSENERQENWGSKKLIWTKISIRYLGFS